MTFSAVSSLLSFAFPRRKREPAFQQKCLGTGFEADIEVWGRKIKGSIALLQRRASYQTRKGRCSTLICCMSLSFIEIDQ
ncbi:hypothetical protein DQW09_17050 [Ensifer adhaerens]|nr:hypothetical protein DQW09_17050 [Ensifer adhaerens]